MRGNAFGAPREYYQSGGDTSLAWDTRRGTLVTAYYDREYGSDESTGGHPPQLCHASASNASIANDEDIYIAAVPIH